MMRSTIDNIQLVLYLKIINNYHIIAYKRALSIYITLKR
jgi:hypothetical protein